MVREETGHPPPRQPRWKGKAERGTAAFRSEDAAIHQGGGHSPRASFACLEERGDVEVHGVGDCLSPRTAEEAVLDGLKVGSAL